MFYPHFLVINHFVEGVFGMFSDFRRKATENAESAKVLIGS